MYQASTAKFLHYHKFNQYDNQRLGQRFCNLFIRHEWTELFYQINEAEAARLIDKWLTDHQYTDNLPVPLDKVLVPNYPGFKVDSLYRHPDFPTAV